MPLVAAIDIGTTNTKGCIVRDDALPIAFAGVATPSPKQELHGQREHDPTLHWWNPFCQTLELLIERLPQARSDLSAIFVSGMWPTFLLVDQEGAPLGDALLYNDARPIALQSRQDPETDCIEGFEWAPRFRWWKAARPGRWERARRVHTTHSYLVNRLTGSYVLDYHTALGTGSLYDAESGTWSQSLAKQVCPPEFTLPAIVGPAETVGTLSLDIRKKFGLTRHEVLVAAGTGDTFVSLISAGVGRAGDTAVYGGTVGHMIQLREPVIEAILRVNRGRDEERISWLGMHPRMGPQVDWCRKIVSPNNCSWEEFNSQLGDRLNKLRNTNNRLERYPLYCEYAFKDRVPTILGEARSLLLDLQTCHSSWDVAYSIMEYLALKTRLSLANARPAVSNDTPLLLGGGVFRTGNISRLMAAAINAPCQIVDHSESALGAALLLAHKLGYLDLMETQQKRRVRGQTFLPDADLARFCSDRYYLLCEVHARLRQANVYV